MTEIVMLRSYPTPPWSRERSSPWFKSTGDQIEAGDELLEIETDKSTAPYVAAERSGTLEVLAAVGTTVAVGEPIGRIGSGSEMASQTESPKRPSAESIAAVIPEMHSATEVPSRTEQRGSVAHNGHGQATDDRKATPLARRVAAAHNVALERVTGTGPLGRITRADVLDAAGIALTRPTHCRTEPIACGRRTRGTAAETLWWPPAGTHPRPAADRDPNGGSEVHCPALPSTD